MYLEKFGGLASLGKLLAQGDILHEHVDLVPTLAVRKGLALLSDPIGFLRSVGNLSLGVSNRFQVLVPHLFGFLQRLQCSSRGILESEVFVMRNIHDRLSRVIGRQGERCS